MIVPLTGGEAILRGADREISILVARPEVTVTHSRIAPGERVAGPHVHRAHTDAFYVLDGGLTFTIGREAETVTAGPGGLVVAPPGLAHALGNDGREDARWLTIHAHDGGFAAFMRGIRDGVRVDWDFHPVPADGGLPAGDAIVSRHDAGNAPGSPWTRCALPDISVAELRLSGPYPALPPSRRGRGVDSILVIDGEVEAAVPGSTDTVGPDTLICVPCGRLQALGPSGRGAAARVLCIHTPDVR